jgi:hypothetical protein
MYYLPTYYTYLLPTLDLPITYRATTYLHFCQPTYIVHISWGGHFQILPPNVQKKKGFIYYLEVKIKLVKIKLGVNIMGKKIFNQYKV